MGVMLQVEQTETARGGGGGAGRDFVEGVGVRSFLLTFLCPEVLLLLQEAASTGLEALVAATPCNAGTVSAIGALDPDASCKLLFELSTFPLLAFCSDCLLRSIASFMNSSRTSLSN